MSLPEIIPVKYSEEEAEFISMRPLVRQSFRAAELVDMIVSVTGKDSQRVLQILRSGTVVFHGYRYWWQGFEAEPEKVSEILARYPDCDPARPFRPEDCTEVILESGGGFPLNGSVDAIAHSLPSHTTPQPNVSDAASPRALRLRRDDAIHKRLFRARSLWSVLLDLARDHAPAYHKYSYALRGDLYSLSLTAGQALHFHGDAARYTSSALRPLLPILRATSKITFVCPRK